MFRLLKEEGLHDLHAGHVAEQGYEAKHIHGVHAGPRLDHEAEDAEDGEDEEALFGNRHGAHFGEALFEDELEFPAFGEPHLAAHEIDGQEGQRDIDGVDETGVVQVFPPVHIAADGLHEHLKRPDEGLRGVQELHGRGRRREETGDDDDGGQAGLGIDVQRPDDAHGDGAEDDRAGEPGGQQQAEDDAADGEPDEHPGERAAREEHTAQGHALGEPVFSMASPKMAAPKVVQMSTVVHGPSTTSGGAMLVSR